MKTLVPVLLLAAAVGFAQRYGGGAYAPQPMGSISGFGSVLFPGLGHAPLPGNAFGSVLHPGGVYPGSIRHGGGPHRNAVVYPYYISPGYFESFDSWAARQDAAQQQPQQPTVVVQQPAAASSVPNVVINQYFRSDGSPASQSEFQGSGTAFNSPAPVLAPRPKVADEKATIYLIAFKDHTIMPALAYWVQGDTLNYITRDGTPNTASMSLIDRDFSRQLNDERGVEFSLR